MLIDAIFQEIKNMLLFCVKFEMQDLTMITICLSLTLIIILAVYGMLKSFHKTNQKQLSLLREELIRAQDKSENIHNKTLVSLRLQAYERMVLFLERIHPNNLIPRMVITGQNIATFQSALLQVIREEYEHNLSQQLYVSDLAWESCKAAKENIIQLIIQSSSAFKPTDDAAMLANSVLTAGLNKENDPLNKALQLMKKEIRQQF